MTMKTTNNNFFNFDKEIMNDLIAQGYKGQDLAHKFNKIKQAIPKAMEKLTEEAQQESAMTKAEAEKAIEL